MRAPQNSAWSKHGLGYTPTYKVIEHSDSVMEQKGNGLHPVRIRIVVRPTFAGTLQELLPNVAKKKAFGQIEIQKVGALGVQLYGIGGSRVSGNSGVVK